jgi:hypothetical protein
VSVPGPGAVARSRARRSTEAGGEPEVLEVAVAWLPALPCRSWTARARRPLPRPYRLYVSSRSRRATSTEAGGEPEVQRVGLRARLGRVPQRAHIFPYLLFQVEGIVAASRPLLLARVWLAGLLYIFSVPCEQLRSSEEATPTLDERLGTGTKSIGVLMLQGVLLDGRRPSSWDLGRVPNFGRDVRAPHPCELPHKA